MTQIDVLILGAGAAGLMCAIHAARRGRRVLVLEHADRPGKKILISGGGRCNFTNRNTTPENFLSANPHFAKSALARYTPQDFLALVEKHGIPWHEKTLGQLFCDRSAQDILNMLLAEATEADVRIQLGTRILSVIQTSTPIPARFRVGTSAGAFTANALVVATGGLSIPKMGATPLGYEFARQFGHTIVDTRPALVPLVLDPDDQADWCDLTGLSIPVIASVSAGTKHKSRPSRTTFRESMLFTHRGLSGPVILQISSYWRPGEPIDLNLIADFTPASPTKPAHVQANGSGPSIFDPLTAPTARRDLVSAEIALRAALPARMATRWLALHASTNRPSSGFSNAALAEMDRQLHAWRILPAGTEGYAKAEVTAGGVSTNELDARTMQSRIVPGLYFIGEVVDVTGWLGGYNFQWAWASGFSAGQSA
jgi:predicted Rossmann fold flavoprotein